MLCSVVKQGETREVVECFSLLLECYRRFLSALQQNRAQSRLLYDKESIIYDKESIIFPTHSPLFSDSFFPKRIKCRQRALYSHEARLFQPITTLVRMLQMIWLTNETTAVNHKLNLSLTFGFEVQTSASKFTFQSGNKDLKASCPMKSGRIVVQENMSFSNMTITRQRPRSLRLKLSKLLSCVWIEEQLYLR